MAIRNTDFAKGIADAASKAIHRKLNRCGYVLPDPSSWVLEGVIAAVVLSQATYNPKAARAEEKERKL